MKNLLEAMHNMKNLKESKDLQDLYDDMNKYDLDTEYREAFARAVENLKIKEGKDLSNKEIKDIIKFIVDYVGEDDYQSAEFKKFSDKYANLSEDLDEEDESDEQSVKDIIDDQVEKDVEITRDVVRGLLEMGAIDDPEYYESLDEKGKERLVDYWFEHYDDDLKENKSADTLGEDKALNEERYYYGEIERVRDTIKSELMGIGHIRKALQEAYDENEEDYTQEMIDILGEADAYFEGVENKCKEISEKLAKVFPNRIRKLTSEEEAEIKRRISNGEM